jgi:hypothetical protein
VLAHRHHGRQLDPKAAFRSRLLQFALIFTHRMHHEETWTTEESLAALREANKGRGEYWQQRTQHPPALQQPFDQQKDFPLSDGALYENRNQLATDLNMPLDQRRWVTDVAGTPSLHCILPLLLELTAARVNLDDDWLPTLEWFDLIGQLMLQAVIEEYLRNGAYGPDVFNTIFAFGCPGVERWAEEPGAVTAMRRLFCDENRPRAENREWTSIKRQYINEVCMFGLWILDTALTVNSFYRKILQDLSYKRWNRHSNDIPTAPLKTACFLSSSIFTMV